MAAKEEKKPRLTTEQLKQLPRATMLFVGREFDSRDRKQYYVWWQLDDSQQGWNSGSPFVEARSGIYPRRWSFSKNIATARPGAIFTIQYDPQADVVYLGSAQYVEMWANEQDVITWQLANDAAAAAYQADSDRRKASRENLPFRNLEPFHDAYQRLRPQERPFLMAKVLHWIMFGSNE